MAETLKPSAAEAPLETFPEQPDLLIDTDAVQPVQDRLHDIRIYLQANPQARLTELRAFTADILSVPDDSMWHDLTDRGRETCRSYWFDDATQESIGHDRTYRQLRAQAAKGEGYLMRARGLEIFLTRLQSVQTAGKVSIAAAE